jgi:hypothetical protein
MPILYLTPPSIGYLTQCILALVITAYLAHLARQAWRRGQAYLQTSLLAVAFGLMTCLILFLFLDGSLRSDYRCPAPVDDRLAESIRQAALAAWRVIGCRGYARVDLRVDAHDQPYVIEVNCNPDLSPEAGFFQAVRRVGYNYGEMVCRIVELTLG